MANHKSAEKRARQTIVRTERNRFFKTRLKNVTKEVIVAIDAGDKEHGATVHFVTAELDSGPIILQAKVPVFAEDKAEDLAERVLTQEHSIYPLAAKWFLSGRLTMENNQALLDGHVLPENGYAAD